MEHLYFQWYRLNLLFKSNEMEIFLFFNLKIDHFLMRFSKKEEKDVISSLLLFWKRAWGCCCESSKILSHLKFRRHSNTEKFLFKVIINCTFVWKHHLYKVSFWHFWFKWSFLDDFNNHFLPSFVKSCHTQTENQFLKWILFVTLTKNWII